MLTEKQQRRAGMMLKYAALGMVMITVAGCVVEPYPPEPPAPGYAAYPGPYSYYDYPPYPYYSYGGPSVGFVFDDRGGGGHWGHHGWR